MSLERLNLYNPVQEQLNVLRDMRRYHQEIQDADTVASFNVQFAGSLEVVESESVQPVQNVNVRKLSRKHRRAARIERNKSHKGADRAHGKRHGKKYLDSLPRKKHLEADNYDHATFKVVNGKLRPIKDVKRARETAKAHDALNISRVERLTASVLAHMSNHVFMWDEQLVWDLTEALCEEYRQVFPDDSYICVYGNHVNLYMQYMDGSVIVDERRYTLR